MGLRQTATGESLLAAPAEPLKQLIGGLDAVRRAGTGCQLVDQHELLAFFVGKVARQTPARISDVFADVGLPLLYRLIGAACNHRFAIRRKSQAGDCLSVRPELAAFQAECDLPQAERPICA